MLRLAIEVLREWLRSPGRKPLVVRGARQVGKSYLVRDFARQTSLDLLELNLERHPEFGRLFASNSPARILQLLAVHFERDIEPGQALLFLDEVQAAPSVLATLRYFHEEVPALAIVAAGSLLDFALEDHTFSMPVGRIEYLHLGPMRFEEFVLAAGKAKLAKFLGEYTLEAEVPGFIHGQLMDLLRQFLVVGGMPEAVDAWVNGRSFTRCEAIKQALLATFEDDFGKYGARVNRMRLGKVFHQLPRLVGSRFKYVHIDREERSKDLALALNHLCLARVAHRVQHSSCAGVPLGATTDERRFKVLFLDVGLVSSACGLSLLDLEHVSELVQVNAGAVAEQFVGQELLTSLPSYHAPELHFWTREARNSRAEVDYVIEEAGRMLPVEVKAGKTGTLRSLHLFLREKRLDLGIRLNSDPPSLLTTEAAVPDDGAPAVRLLSLPLYMAGQVRRLARGGRVIRPV